MAKKRTTPAERAYAKERRRIERQINRMEKRGFDVPKNILPPRPKRVTEASVRRLKNIDTNKLYSKSRYVDKETGEIITGEAGRKAERKESARKAAETRRRKKEVKPRKEPEYVLESPEYINFSTQIFTVFQMEMTEIFGRNERLFNYVSGWFNRSRQRYGDEDFAEALEESKANGMWPGWQAVSNEEILVGSLRSILDLITASEGGKEEIMEQAEEMTAGFEEMETGFDESEYD